MKKSFLKSLLLQLALFVVVLPELASAQQFVYNPTGDVLTGFRKMNTLSGNGDQGNYELVVNLGSVTNLLNVPIGNTITLSNVNYSALTNAFLDTVGSEPVLAQIQWSVFVGVPSQPGPVRTINPWVTPLGVFPGDTLLFTLPSTNVNVQTAPPSRFGSAVAGNYVNAIGNIGSGAVSISSFLGASNANNTPFLIREPDSTYGTYDLTTFIGQNGNNALGNFGSSQNSPFPAGVVENTTPNPFTAAQRNDFYMLCPTATTNPITGSTNDSYFAGYFLLNANGTMTFTRANSTYSPPPAVVSVVGSVTSGSAPLQVVFSNTSTGTITNWVWNFGNGTIITNTTGGNVTNTYAAVGTYTVTLTVYGPGGSNTDTLTSYITVSAASSNPKFNSLVLSGGQLILSGTNGAASAQYRIFTTTNLALPFASWTPVYTNNFLGNGSFAYTNSTAKPAAFFRLVSP